MCNCGKEIQYDEGEGNSSDGYVCYECIESGEFGDLE